MAILRQRTRRVAFRISEDEYQRLRNACVSRGARSISDLARTAVDRLIAHENGGDTVTEDIAMLAQTVRHLKRKVELLSLRLGGGDK